MKKKECKKKTKAEQPLTEEWASYERNASYAMQVEANEYFEQIKRPPSGSSSDEDDEEGYYVPKEQKIKIKQDDNKPSHKIPIIIQNHVSDDKVGKGSFLDNRRNSNLNIYEEELSGSGDIDSEEGDESISDTAKRIRDQRLIGKNVDRTRRRSFEDKYKDQGDSYFSVSRELQYKSKNFTKKREMRDIENESLQTSYHINQKSFKWSTQLKYPSITQKKGALQNYYENQLQNMAQKEKNQQKNLYFEKDEFSSNSLQSTHLKGQLATLKSPESYSTALSFFLDKFRQQQELSQNQHYGNHLSFQYYSKLDSGSFGQVDLYFFEMEDEYSLVKQQINQESAEKKNLYLQDQQQLIEPKKEFSSQNTYLSSYNMNSSSHQNILESMSSNSSIPSKRSLFTKGISQESTQMDSQEIQHNFINSSTIKAQSSAIVKQTPGLSINNVMNKKNLLPVAGKKIKIKNEFIRELYIMQKVNSEFMPKVISSDIEQQILFLELGLCSLYDLKMDSQQNKYKLSDDLTYSILINLFQAIESLLQNYNYKEQKFQQLFHSDIKPQNIILTIKKDKDNESHIKLLLIDYGGSSFELEDYWSYFTPAFVCNSLWERLVNQKEKKEVLTWTEVRYAEVYAACRSVQFLILEEKNQNLFKKSSCQEFLNEYQSEYPKTCRILENVFIKNKDSKIFSHYSDILQSDEMSSSNQIIPQRIFFDQDKIFKMSRFYNILNSSQ